MADRLAPVLMVQGTASSVGKSTLVAGLCRLFARRGVRVAPFKAQNMSNNAAVCPAGGEIGRAQFAQAEAARVTPAVDMNPVLLKPQGGTSQVIVRGEVQGTQTAAEYFSPGRRTLWPVVAECLDRLRANYDLVIAEGAGSPAEVNLRHRDLANMRVALYAQADVLLVADIDRGGAFAALLGTWQWMAHDERALVRGFVLNKFRGDARLLAPAPALLEERTGVPVVGIVPYLDDLVLPEEDAASLVEHVVSEPVIEIAIVRLPHVANFDEFDALAAERGVHVRWVTHAEALRAPDLVILPGTKATISDLLWLGERGLARRMQPLDQGAMAATRQHQAGLTKPPGSLGRLERLAVPIAGITGNPRPRLEQGVIPVMAGDHGVTAEGVSAYPSEVTRQMVENFAAGGAAINVLVKNGGA